MIDFQIQPTPTLHAGTPIPDEDTKPYPAMLTAYDALNGCRGAYAGVKGGEAGLEGG